MARLYDLGTENNLSRAQLALNLNVSIRLISYWKNGKHEYDFDMLLKIADLFSISVDYLLGKKDY